MKINGNDILLAIGEIDERLLAYPARRTTSYRRRHALTLAASIFLCITVLITVYASVVFKGAMKGDAMMPGFDNAMPEDNGSAAKPSIFREIMLPVSIDLDTAPNGVGILGDEYHGDTVSVFVTDGAITVLIPEGHEGELIAIYMDNEQSSPTHTEISYGYAKYKIASDALEAIEYVHDGVTYRVEVVRRWATYITLSYTEEMP